MKNKTTLKQSVKISYLEANRPGATLKLAYRPVGPVVNFFLN